MPDKEASEQSISSPRYTVTRRECFAAAGALTGAVLTSTPADAAPTHSRPAKNSVPIEIEINGNHVRRSLDPRVTLLDLLREDLGLTGTKKGCDHGQCGACTVLLNGRRINSCLALAAAHNGGSITTIEGLAKGENLHPMQAAFIRHDGLQCGYCTPGQICSAVALLDEAKRGDLSFVTQDLATDHPIALNEPEIRERMSGNICRCGAYPGIVASVAELAHPEQSQ